MLTSFLLAVLAGIASIFSGSTFTSVLGSKETKDNLILKVNTEGNVKTVSLDGYSVMNYDNVSISGVVVVDSNGNIIEYRDVNITGVPAKLTSVSGVLSDSQADVTLKGKAAGMFKFEVHYKAKPTKF